MMEVAPYVDPIFSLSPASISPHVLPFTPYIMKQFIIIAGNIGVGKSTLTARLADRLNWTPVFEAVDDNPYLADFYDDMPRWAFNSQVFFLSRRVLQHHKLSQYQQSVIQDRSVYEDANIFARNLFVNGSLDARDWQTYQELYETLTVLLPPPDLMIYLRAAVPTLQTRIALRGRDYEQTIPDTYLQQLNTLYDQWASTFTLCPVLTIETDRLDYVRRPADFEQTVSQIEQTLGIQYPLDIDQ